MSRLREVLTRLVAGRAPQPARMPVDTKASMAGPLLTFETLGRPVWAPRDYGTFAREGYAQNAIVHRCVRMTAEACASIPLLVYEGGREVEAHALVDLMRRPSPGMTGTDLLEQWYGFLLVAGNAYMEAVALDGEIRELHALRPDRMKVVPGPDGWPEAWEYEVAGRSVRFAGEVADGVRPILHLKLFNPTSDHYGLSPIEAAATAIDIHNEAARWNKALLDNSARPSGALVYAAANGQMTGEQFERLKRELEATYQGAKHAGRPLLLEGGLDWKPLSLSPKDMDFIEAKHAAAREIALALGVPPMLLGIPGDNTYSNYQEASRAFWRQTVLPLVGRTTRALSEWLGGGTMEWRADLDNVEALAPEREALWTRLDKATFLTTAEKRAAAGFDGEDSGVGVQLKYNPYHDELGLFTTEDQAVDPQGRRPRGRGDPFGAAPDGTPVEPASRVRGTVRVRAGGQVFDATPAQAQRLNSATDVSREMQRRVRELEPEWRSPESMRNTIEGAIAHHEAVAVAAHARVAELVPRGFRDYENYAAFGRSVRDSLEAAGHRDIQLMMRGSAVTGQRYRTGEPFDSGRLSDYDLAVISPTLLQRAAEIGVPLRSGGNRTGPLTVTQLDEIGLRSAASEATKLAGRNVSFMIYSSRNAVDVRGPYRPIPVK